MEFLWITISLQRPQQYRNIVTTATSADDWHQAHDIGKACEARNMRSHIPAWSKHQNNGVRVLTAWELGKAK